ncbi:hypothetical protein GCM10020331_079810 [Ectobacillus funiculus]
MPVVWTKRWGLGNVFYNSLGHQANIVAMPEVSLIMRRGFFCGLPKERNELKHWRGHLITEITLYIQVWEIVNKLYNEGANMKKT